MTRKWKPGDVALYLIDDTVGVLFRTDSQRRPWIDSDGEKFTVGNDEDVRPLALIDPEDDKQVTRLLAEFMLHERGSMLPLTPKQATPMMQDALRSFIEPRRPEVYEHLTLIPANVTRASVCGKVWVPNPDVTVVGRCPECVQIAADGWVS